MDITIVKRHPYATGAVVVFFILVVYLIMKRRSSASSPDLSGGDVALTQASTASGLASAQINAGVEIAQIQGQVATNQVNAQLEAANKAQDTALSIVQTQTARDVAVEQSKDLASVQVASIGANAATDIAHTQANAALGIANIQGDIEKTQIASLADVAKTLGTQKQLGSKVTNLIAALQGPQAIAANQPAAVATVNAGVAGGPVGFLKALNPAGLLSAFFGG